MSTDKKARARVHNVSPVTGENGPLPSDVALNEQIAIYNWTGNPLAAWKILEICLCEKRNLPDEISDFISKAAGGLVKLCEESRDARYLTADVVLGTKNESGGRSVFSQYQSILDDRKMIAELHALMAIKVVEGIGWTQSEVFSEIAGKFGKSMDWIKKKYESSESEGVWPVGDIQRKKKKRGIQDI